MGVPLQQYRIQIGLFVCSRLKRTRISQNHVQKSESLHIRGIFKLLLLLSLIITIIGISTSTIQKPGEQNTKFSLELKISYFPTVSLQVLGEDDQPDPGGGEVQQVPVLIDNNFWARYINGNRTRGIKLCHWNIGGGYLQNKTDHINKLIDDYSPHILGISEASFWSFQNLDDIQIPKYKVFLACTLSNPQLNVSRIAVYVHEDISVTVRNDLMNEEFSSVWLEVGLTRQKKFLISHIYRDWQFQGQQNVDSLTVPEQRRRWDLFLQQWEIAISEGLEIHSQGDFNLNFLDFNKLDTLPINSQSYKLKSLILALKDRIIPHGFCQLIEDATRIWPGATASLLDHHWTNQEEKITYSHAYFQGASDHKMICVTRRTKKIISKPKIIKKRNFKNFNQEAFISEVSRTSWLDVYLCEDLDKAVNLVTGKLNRILDIMAPVKIIQVRSSYAPWMSLETKERIKKRNTAQRIAAETQNIEDWQEYKKLRNSITKTLQQEKKIWQEKKLKSCGNNSGSVWKNVKTWLGWSSGASPTRLVENGSVYNKPKDLSQIMNNYFVSKVKNLRDNLPPNPGDPLALVKRIMMNRTSSMKLKCVHPDQVVKIISSMKSSSSCGLDSLDSRIIKMAKYELAPVITHLVNLSIRSGSFPLSWKESKVIPLHKKNEKIYPKNYRPVSLLPVISKVLERAIFEQFTSYLETNDLLHPSHHGFRANHSTVTALIEMYDQWIEAFENDEVTAVVMLDLSAAFDVVDHEILIQKLKLYGFEDCAISWLRSYLSGRSQRVYVEGALSESLKLEAGVPQGSILGPLLYILYTNDLPQVLHDHPQPETQVEPPDYREAHVGQLEQVVQEHQDHHPQQHGLGPGLQAIPTHQFNTNCKECGAICIFADDSTFSLSNKDTGKLKEDIKIKYESIRDYMNKNKLILNSDKTHLLVMTSEQKHKKHNNFGISLDTGSEVIEPISEERLLGGTVSSNLKWNCLIRDSKQSLTSVLTSRINALSKVTRSSGFKNRKLIANGVVMSQVTYLIQLYGGCSEFLLSALQVLQNRAARLVTRLGWWTPTATLLLQCGWLSIRQTVVYHSILLLFKAKQNRKPEYLYSKISHKFTKVTRNSTTGGVKDNRRFHSVLATQSFLPRTIKIWNDEIPWDLRTENSISQFKQKLRNWVKNNVKI